MYLPFSGLSANRVEIIFPYKYNFGITLDVVSTCVFISFAICITVCECIPCPLCSYQTKALSVKRFLQDLHGRQRGVPQGHAQAPSPLFLPVDVLAECEELVFQLSDDPFEVKLRANYEVSLVCALNYHTVV